jgi:hypothetical protein
MHTVAGPLWTILFGKTGAMTAQNCVPHQLHERTQKLPRKVWNAMHTVGQRIIIHVHSTESMVRPLCHIFHFSTSSATYALT